MILILGFAFTAMAISEHRLKRQVFGTCIDQCTKQDTQMLSTFNMLSTAPNFGATAETLSETLTAIRTLKSEDMVKYCTRIPNMKNCVGNCNNPKDKYKKEKAVALLNAIQDIVCDTDIQSNIECFQKVSTPTCDEQCQKKTVDTQYGKPCAYINCNLKCYKGEYEKKCPNNGYAAFKKLVKKNAFLAKVFFFGDTPTACTPDDIVQGA